MVHSEPPLTGYTTGFFFLFRLNEAEEGDANVGLSEIFKQTDESLGLSPEVKAFSVFSQRTPGFFGLAMKEPRRKKYRCFCLYKYQGPTPGGGGGSYSSLNANVSEGFGKQALKRDSKPDATARGTCVPYFCMFL